MRLTDDDDNDEDGRPFCNRENNLHNVVDNQALIFVILPHFVSNLKRRSKTLIVLTSRITRTQTRSCMTVLIFLEQMFVPSPHIQHGI